MDANLSHINASDKLQFMDNNGLEGDCLCLVDRVREKLLSWSQQRLGEDEFVRAKEEFFWKTGKVFHDDHFYEARMEYFVDHFLLERPLSTPFDGDLCLTPFETYQKFVDSTLNAGIERSIHSLFQVAKLSTAKMLLVDLVSGQKLEIVAREGESFRAVCKKDLFQGFVYCSNQYKFLSKGTIFHPTKAVRLIKKDLKKSKLAADFDSSRFLADLAKLQLRHLRHAHVDPKRIYCES